MISEFETKLLGIMMIIIMLGMGASLTWRDFLIAFRKPKGLLIGVLCQYGIMPVVGFAGAMMLGLDPAVAVGLLLISCMPGGTTSNIFSYFSKGVLALSIMMTSFSTLLALVMVPSLLSFYASAAGITGNFNIPTANVAMVLAVLLVPTLIGMILRRVNPNIGASIELLGGILSVAVIVFLVVTWVPRNYGLLAITPWQAYAASVGLGLVGIALGFGFAKLLKQDNNRSRTIAIETGIQNGPLAVLIVTLTFSGSVQQDVLLIPVLYSLFIVITSSAITVWFRRISTRETIARDQAKVGMAYKTHTD
jgi:bile acid transporter